MASDEQVVNAVTTLILPGEKEHDHRRRRYDHSYEVYRASRPATGIEPWQSRLRVKYGMQVIDTALVNIVSGEPKVKVTGRGPEDELGAKGMQAVLDYHIRHDHLVERRPVFAQQGLIYGVTAAKNHWIYKTGRRVKKTWTRDQLTGALVGGTETVDVVDRDGPTFEPLNVYYTFWDPNAYNVDTCRYVACDYWVSPEELKQNAFDPETEKGIYHNVQALLEAGDRGAKQPETTAQERFIGGAENKRKGLIHLREIWWMNQGEVWLTVVGNGKTLIRHQPSPYWHGQIPIVISQPRPDLFEIQGLPETELVDHIQEALHTLQNMTIDNLHMTVMRGVTYREGGVTDPNSIVLRPRFKWPVIDHDDIRPFEIQPLSTDVFTERQRLLSDLQLVTGINPYVSGSDLGSVDQNTATGVTALQEVASRLLRFKAGQLEYSGYQRSFEMWGAMIQQFQDSAVAVKIIGDHGREEWLTVGPQDVVGQFDYTLEGSEESLSRQQERGEAIQLLNAIAPFVQFGVNPKAVLEKVASAYGLPNPESLFAPQQQQQQQPAAPVAPQQPFNGQPQLPAAQANPTLVNAQQFVRQN